MDYSNFPKIELHLHLDCSLSYKVVQQLKPSVSEEEFKRDYIAPAKCNDLADYITRAAKGIELMQTAEQLWAVTLDLFEQLKADNVIYAEIRFAPLLHLEEGLSPHEVVQIVNAASIEGMERTGVKAGLILATLRHYTEAQSMETVKLVASFKGTNVVGFDIAADEAGFPIDAHIKAFKYAKKQGISCTAHAGEARGADSVWETLRHFHPKRIGHGVRSIEDPELMTFLKAEGIHLEICPTSNVQTAIYDKIEDHRVDDIYQSGVSMSINTDARTISDVRLADEYATLKGVFGWDKARFLKCNLEAIKHAFTDEQTKEAVKRQLLQAWT
ncbi:MAG: adenosine deaminase [Saprospiraceae bacterium]|nr:adenosine deaminase [Saprospiraceae bacterium]